jgi:hypothetical protein
MSIPNPCEKTLNMAKGKWDPQLEQSKRRWRLQATPSSLR